MLGEVISFFMYFCSNINDDCSDDFTVSYLDGIVVRALESGLAPGSEDAKIPALKPYIPNRSWRWKETTKRKKLVISFFNLWSFFPETLNPFIYQSISYLKFVIS